MTKEQQFLYTSLKAYIDYYKPIGIQRRRWVKEISLDRIRSIFELALITRESEPIEVELSEGIIFELEDLTIVCKELEIELE